MTGAAQLSVAHADAATCATTAALGAADFLAVALAVDPAALMPARAQNGRMSVRCERTLLPRLLRLLARLPGPPRQVLQPTQCHLQNRPGWQERQQRECGEPPGVARTVKVKT